MNSPPRASGADAAEARLASRLPRAAVRAETIAGGLGHVTAVGPGDRHALTFEELAAEHGFGAESTSPPRSQFRWVNTIEPEPSSSALEASIGPGTPTKRNALRGLLSTKEFGNRSAPDLDVAADGKHLPATTAVSQFDVDRLRATSPLQGPHQARGVPLNWIGDPSGCSKTSSASAAAAPTAGSRGSMRYGRANRRRPLVGNAT